MARNKQTPKSTGHPQMDKLVNGSDENLANGLPALTGQPMGSGAAVGAGYSHLNGSLGKQFGENDLDD